MSNRRLSDAERALWRKVEASTKPLTGRTELAPAPDGVKLSAHALPNPATKRDVRGRTVAPKRAPAPQATISKSGLDHNWDRKLARGALEPDFMIDLHGLSLDQAWRHLNRTLAEAISSRARTLLIITGKDRGPDVRLDPSARGRIRAKVADWIDSSEYSNAVRAVRPAARRHGGDGALYIILKRDRRL